MPSVDASAPPQRLPERAREAPRSRRYSFVERLQFAAVARVSYWLIWLIGKSLRWETENWHYRTDHVSRGQAAIYAFWHGRIFPATYHYRNNGIVVMTSRHRDGEYIAPLIRRFGFGVARGSSTRGGRGALAEMQRMLEQKRDVAFTIDGPRGPRYVAKPGAVWLAAQTGCAVLPFDIACERKWTLSTWDAFEIPKPFSRIAVCLATPIEVPRRATEEQMAEAQRRLQQSLDGLRERCDHRWSR